MVTGLVSAAKTTLVRDLVAAVGAANAGAQTLLVESTISLYYTP
jgi:hypothetical protein